MMMKSVAVNFRDNDDGGGGGSGGGGDSDCCDSYRLAETVVQARKLNMGACTLV